LLIGNSIFPTSFANPLLDPDLAHLDVNIRGLHAIDMLTLQMSMQTCYEQADGIPQYIALLEDAQKKAKRAQMPIGDAELVMMASAAVLAV